MLTLCRFEEEDFDELIAAIPDARAHLQWAGPEYAYPLDASQLRETLAHTEGGAPHFRMYKAVLAETGETVGHVQLMGIDYREGSCTLGKVLVFPPYQGRGLGTALVQAAVHEAFDVVGMRRMVLIVFAHNQAALSVYENVGFIPLPPHPAPLFFEDERWEALRMVLHAEDRPRSE